jgi:hypothetical protein
VVSHRVGRPAVVGEEAPSPSILSALSRRPALAFGFRNFLADVAWLEAVQVSGTRRMARKDYDRLSDLLSTVVRFDPRFVIPYLLGGIVLGESADHSDAAIQLLGLGEQRFPAEWRFPFYAGYIHYFSKGNPEEGGMSLLRAARVPGSPAYFPLLATRMLAEGNRTDTALAFLKKMLEQEADPRRKASLKERMRRVEVERDIQLLERAITEYTSRVGTPPMELPDLVRIGVLPSIPEEPYGGKYLLTSNGGVRSDRAPGGRLKVFRIQ